MVSEVVQKRIIDLTNSVFHLCSFIDMGCYTVWGCFEGPVHPLQIYSADLCSEYEQCLLNLLLLKINNFICDYFFLFFLNFLTIFPQDLKKYHFYYWFCFPALCFPEGIKIVQQPSVLEQVFSAKQVGFLEIIIKPLE